MIGTKAGNVLLAFFAFCVLLVLPARPAYAHASLLSSSPADGARLSIAPDQVRMLFSEPLIVRLCRASVERADGSLQSLEIESDPDEARAIIARLPTLTYGSYRVIWNVVSADGHPRNGFLEFSIADTAHAARVTAPWVQPPRLATRDSENEGVALLPAIFRGLALWFLLALCGLLGFTAYSESGASRNQVRLLKWLSGGSVVLLLVHLIAWLAHIAPMGTLDAGFVAASLSERVGADELVRLILAALAMWAIVLARRYRMGFAFALAAVLAGGTIGHSAAMHPAIAIPTKAFHLVGVAFWMGGILWLLTLDLEGSDAADAASTVSTIALGCILIVAVTGLVQTTLFLNRPQDLIASGYGVTVLVKIAGIVVLAVFGAYHRSLLRAGKLVPALRKSLRREIIVMIVVVLVGGYLAYVPTPAMPIMGK